MLKKLLFFAIPLYGTLALAAKDESIVQEITQDGSEAITRQAGQKPIVIDFYADWCSPCRTMKPVFEKLAQELKGEYTFLKANTEKVPNLAKKYGVTRLPTFVVLKGDTAVGTITGAKSAEQFKNELKKLTSFEEASNLDKDAASGLLVESIQTLDIGGIKKCIAAGADINAPTERGITPLLMALIMAMSYPEKAVEVVSLLLDAGCTTDIKDPSTGTVTSARAVVQSFIDQYTQAITEFKEIIKKFDRNTASKA